MTYNLFIIFYSFVLGFLSQNLALALGVGSGNLLKLSGEAYNGKRRYFFIIMFITTFLSSIMCKTVDRMTVSFPQDSTSFISLVRPLLYVITVAIVEIALEAGLSYAFPALREKIGDILPSACFNSCVLAILLLNHQMEGGFLECMTFAVTATAGFALSVILIRALRERMHLSHCPEFMKGAPIALLAAGLLSLAFMGVINISVPYLVN